MSRIIGIYYAKSPQLNIFGHKFSLADQIMFAIENTPENLAINKHPTIRCGRCGENFKTKIVDFLTWLANV